MVFARNLQGFHKIREETVSHIGSKIMEVWSVKWLGVEW